MPLKYDLGILSGPLHRASRLMAERNAKMPLRKSVLALAIALTGCVCMLDYVSDLAFDLWLLYLVPIGLASFVLGARFGYALALLAGAWQFLTSGLPGSAYPSITTFVGEHGAAASAYVVCAYVIGVMRVLHVRPDAGGPLDALTRPK